MGSGNEFDIVLKLIDQLTPAMANVQNQLKTAMANMAGSAKPASDAMERLSKSLSGDKIIQDAKNIVAAVQQIGGATKLTEAEAAKYNATLTQALAKLKALGQEAPADMLALASATKQADSGMSGFLSSAGKVAATLGVAFGAAAVVGGIKNMIAGVMETADHVHDLAEKLDVSTDAVQRWTYAAKQTGADMSNVSISLGFMNKTLAGGDASTVAALASAGLQFKTIRAMAPEQAFETIAQAIKQIPDPMTQARVATELFGKSGQDLLPAIKEGLIDIGREAPLMSKATIDALEKAGDAIDRFWANVHTRVGTSLGAIALTIEELGKGWQGLSNLKSVGLFNTDEEFINKITKLREAQNALTEDQKRYIASQVAAGVSNDVLTRSVGATAEAVLAYAASLKKVAEQPQLSFGDELQAARAAYTALTSAKRADIEAGFQLGTSEADIAKRMDLTAAVLAVAKKAYDDHKTAVSKASAEAQKFGDAMAELNAVGEGWAGTLDTIDGNVVEAIKFYLAAGVEQGKLAIAYALTGAQVKAVDAAMKDHIEALKTADGITKLFTTEGDKRFKEWFASVAKSLDETNKKVVSTFEGFLKAQKDYHEAVAKDTLDADDFQRFQLQQQLDDAKVKLAELGEAYRSTYDEIAKTVAIKLSEVGTLWKESEHQMIAPKASFDAKQQTDDFARSLRGVTSLLSELGRVGGETWSEIAKTANDVVVSVQSISKAMAALQTTGGFNVQNLASLAAGWLGIWTAMWQVTDAIYAAQDAAKTLMEQFEVSNQAALDFSNTLRENLGTSRLGSGLLTDLQQFSEGLDRAFKTSLDAVNRVYQNETRDDHGAGGINLQRAEALHLLEVIQELGGASNLTAHQLDTVRASVDLLFGMVADGGPLAQDALKELNDTFGELATTDKYGRFSDFFMEMVESARAAGVELTKLDEIMKGQADNAAKGLSDLLQQPLIANTAAVGKAVSDAQDALDKLKESGTASGSALAKAQDALTDALTAQHAAAEQSKQGLDDLGAIALVTFNAAIASGQDFVTALDSIGPALSTIQKAYADLGLTIDDTTLRGLTLENTILHGTAEAPSGLGTAIRGLAAGITAATNLGPHVETPEAAAAQQRALAGLYNQAQAASAAAGTTGDAGTAAALVPFQQTLHQLQDWAKKNGQELDSHTQEMITQSQQLGIWNDDFKSDAEKTRESIADLIKSNYDLAATIGGAAHAPGAGSPGGLPPGLPPWSETDPTAPPLKPVPIPMASGGFGFATGPMMFSTKGNEEYAFSGEGKRFLKGDEQAQAPLQPTVIIAPTFQMSSLKPEGFPEIVEHEVMPIIIGLLKDQVRDFQPRMVAALRQNK